MYWTRESWVYLQSLPDFLTNAASGTLKVAYMLTQYDPKPTVDHFLSGVAGNLPTDPDYTPLVISQTFDPDAESGLIDLVQDSVGSVAAMSGGETVDKMVLYRDTGSAATSPLYIGWSIPVVTFTDHERLLNFGPLGVIATVQGV